MFRTLFDSLTSRGSRPARRTPSQPKSPRLHLEALDDRCLPSTFTVINLLDTGAGSLRAAVAAANTNPGTDAIDFATTGTIALTSGQLDITDSLTINGPGAGALTVSGEGVSRVFALAGDPTVLITGLTVANGRTSDSPGGGISMTGGALTLDHVTVSGNSANGYGVYGNSGYGDGGQGAGGGLYVAGGTLTLDQSTVSGNVAWGGAGATELFLGDDGGPGEGGGLYVANGTVYVNQSTIVGNYARGGAGGDGLQYNSSDWTVGGNGGAAAGGGIRVAAGTVKFYQSSLSGNTAEGGSGGLGIYNGGTIPGQVGEGVGGGLSIASATPPLADLDTFTESNTVNNFAVIDPNISGPYSLNGTFVRTLVIGDVTTAEGHTGTTVFVFTVTLSAASTETITVTYATAGGSATAGSDYEASSGTLTFAPGDTSKTISVLVYGDRLAEPNETFSINLSGPTNAALADGQGVGTIVDDEPRISISDVTKLEGKKGHKTFFTFTVTLSAAYDQAVTVSYRTADSTATTSDGDYLAKSGTLIFAPGETTKTVTIEVRCDSKREANEYFYLDLFGNSSNSLFTKSRGTGTILNDD